MRLLARRERGRTTTLIGSALAIGGLLAVAACGSPGSPGGEVNGSTIKLGLVTSVTGSLASTFGPDVAAGFNARISHENDAGGIDGRKIEATVADDTSSAPGAVTAVQNLIRQDVFAVGSWSAFMFNAYKPLNQGGIPLVGGAFGAPQFGDPSLTNQFSVFGPLDPTFPVYDSYGKLLKQLGVTKLATLGYGTVPSSKNSATAFAASAKAAGIEICYQNYGVAAGGVDFTPIALAIKNAGCDGIYASMVASSQLALAQAVRDSGVTLKGIVSTQGYGQATLDDQRVRQAAQGITFVTPMSPVANPNPGVKGMLDDLQKYANATGVPSFGEFGGWLTADALITGLKAAGKDGTRESFIKAMRGITDYDAGGVLAGPTDFSAEKIGHGDSVLSGSQCWFGQRLIGDSFQSVSGATPFCGKPLARS